MNNTHYIQQLLYLNFFRVLPSAQITDFTVFKFRCALEEQKRINENNQNPILFSLCQWNEKLSKSLLEWGTGSDLLPVFGGKNKGGSPLLRVTSHKMPAEKKKKSQGKCGQKA